MKKTVQMFLPLLAVIMSASFSMAQSQLAQDQNPNYLISQHKYMGISDSLNEYHSTTVQDTYKAIDYLEDKKEARAIRRAYRQQSRYYYQDYDGYYPSYGYNNYGSYNNYYPWNGRQYLNNYLFNTLPLAITLGSYHRHWWR